MKIYEIITTFTFNKKVRRANILLLILDSYKSNFADIIKAFQHVAILNEDLAITINKEEIFLYVFNYIYTSDMSQQQENLSFKSQNTNLKCRFCYIVNIDRNQLDYDLVMNKRFYY